MSTSAKRWAISLAILALLTSSFARAAAVKDNIDWPKFMARHDLVWNRVPEKWGEGAFTGNGLLGLMMYLTDDKAALRFRVGRTDVMIQEKQAYRVPIGDLVLKPVGKITGGKFRQELWNAEVTGTLKTDKGEIGIRFSTHAIDLVNIIELKPSDGEKDCKWEFQPGLSANPRWIRDKQPIPADEKSPPPTTEKEGANHIVRQKVFNGDEYSTSWFEDTSKQSRILWLTVNYARKGHKVDPTAADAITLARIAALQPGQSLDATASVHALQKRHHEWWHDFYRKSFLSIPDTKLESFYWIQLYKLASATRADRPAIDLNGPWYNDTPWPRIWWNLNIQLTYYPVYTANHLELGESLTKMIDAGAENLAKNADNRHGQFSADSETIGRTSGYNCRSPGGNELCNLPWALHNYYMQYRYSMDDVMLRGRLLPRLKRAINYYMHFLEEGPDKKLHIKTGLSPEYHKDGGHPDCNIDLALLRWGCQALLDSCQRLKIDDPLIPRWKDTLARLTPYPTDANGLKVSADTSWETSHRHYSHLLMIYPLYTMNWDQPENRDLIARSFDHWMSLPSAFRGYSWTGAASICAAIERPDDAVKYLNEFLNPEGRYKSLPNTHYMEAGPVIETPLSAARSLQDIVLQSWGGTIRIFPGVPDSWPDVTFHNLRAEGAFLVSAQRRGGKTQFIRIESLAGEPFKLKMRGLSAMEPAYGDAGGHSGGFGGDPDTWTLTMPKGGKATFVPKGEGSAPTIEPVPAQPGRTNAFGLP